MLASGDLRDVIKTSANIPSEFEKPITITINDRDTDVVARNIILLLIGLTSGDTEENVDCMLHVWYSAFLSTTYMEILTTRVRPLIEDVVMKITDHTDPFCGWNIFDVLKHDNGPAINDTYGKLYFHIRDTLLSLIHI